eukprot:6207195-Pleurochrysis_carterae.AAC.10
MLATLSVVPTARIESYAVKRQELTSALHFVARHHGHAHASLPLRSLSTARASPSHHQHVPKLGGTFSCCNVDALALQLGGVTGCFLCCLPSICLHSTVYRRRVFFRCNQALADALLDEIEKIALSMRALIIALVEKQDMQELERLDAFKISEFYMYRTAVVIKAVHESEMLTGLAALDPECEESIKEILEVSMRAVRWHAPLFTVRTVFFPPYVYFARFIALTYILHASVLLRIACSSAFTYTSHAPVLLRILCMLLCFNVYFACSVAFGYTLHAPVLLRVLCMHRCFSSALRLSRLQVANGGPPSFMPTAGAEAEDEQADDAAKDQQAKAAVEDEQSEAAVEDEQAEAAVEDEPTEAAEPPANDGQRRCANCFCPGADLAMEKLPINKPKCLFEPDTCWCEKEHPDAEYCRLCVRYYKNKCKNQSKCVRRPARLEKARRSRQKRRAPAENLEEPEAKRHNPQDLA